MFRECLVMDRSGVNRRVRLEPLALASGADGAIHRVVDEPALVAKLYHDPGKDPARKGKIEAMLADPPGLPPLAAGQGHEIQIAWPVAWLEEAGRFAGYIMPSIDLARATVLENLLARRTRKANGLPESYGYRVTAAANLAAVVAELHAHGHFIVDLKPVNLHVYTRSFHIALLDCDGFSVRGKEGERFPAHQFSDGYICPEALQQSLAPQLLSEAQDRFALAVILFQLLNQGLHPFQGRPVEGRALPGTNGERIAHGLYAYGVHAHPAITPSPWSIHDFFDPSTRRLFDRAFMGPDDRPSAREWHQHLLPYATKGSGRLHACTVNPEHLQFMAGCPWCALEQAGRSPEAVRAEHRRPAELVFINGEKRPRPWGSALLLIPSSLSIPLFVWGSKDVQDLGFFTLAFFLMHLGWFLSKALPRAIRDNFIIDFEYVSNGRGQDYIRFEPQGVEACELVEVFVEDSQGIVSGRITDLRFIPERPFQEGVVHNVNAKLRIRRSASGSGTVTVERQWFFQPGKREGDNRVIW